MYFFESVSCKNVGTRAVGEAPSGAVRNSAPTDTWLFHEMSAIAPSVTFTFLLITEQKKFLQKKPRKNVYQKNDNVTSIGVKPYQNARLED